MRLLLPLAVIAMLLPAPSAAQLVLRNDVNGWGWLAVIEGRRATAQLAFGNPQTGVQGRLDAQLLADLAARGVGRVSDASTFDAALSQVVAECTATDRSEGGGSNVTYAVHAEVSYWDHTRLAATEIYESIRIAAVPQAEFQPATYVEACASAIADVLLRLGFTAG